MKRQLAGYAVTGGLAALVDVGVFWWLSAYVPVLGAAALSFAVAAIVNYRLSASWVFQREWRSLAQALRFALFAIVGLGVNAGVTAMLAGSMPAMQGWGPILAKVAGIGVAFLVNFAMNARWVFAGNTSAGGAHEARRAIRRARKTAPR